MKWVDKKEGSTLLLGIFGEGVKAISFQPFVHKHMWPKSQLPRGLKNNGRIHKLLNAQFWNKETAKWDCSGGPQYPSWGVAERLDTYLTREKLNPQ